MGEAYMASFVCNGICCDGNSFYPPSLIETEEGDIITNPTFDGLECSNGRRLFLGAGTIGGCVGRSFLLRCTRIRPLSSDSGLSLVTNERAPKTKHMKLQLVLACWRLLQKW